MKRNRPALFRGRHFEDVVIVLCVRWYLRYSLSYRDLREMMAERGLSVDHVTIWRWVQHYAPILNGRIRGEIRQPNRSWRVDETYILHFRHIEDLVHQFKPKRVLVDSLSTYGSTLGTQGRIFRDFFHALIALMKEEQLAAVYNHENPEMLGMASMMGEFGMSSLVDNIILMN